MREAIARAFGRGRFVVINDFYSYLAPGSRLFPNWHQDYEFWLTGGERCANFNLWVLLDHAHANHSFDLYEYPTERDRRNDWFYGQLYATVGAATAAPRNRSAAPGPRKAPPEEPVPMVPRSFFSAHGLRERLPVGTPPAGAPPPRVSRVPLRRGEGLVLRQLEVHRTDRRALRAGAWRLAIGFKLLERTPLRRLPLFASPFTGDYATMRALWPGLLPALATGRPFPDVYDDNALRAYKRRARARTDVAARAVEDHPQALIGLVVPAMAGGLVALYLSQRRAAARAAPLR